MAALTLLEEETRAALRELLAEDESLAADDRVEIMRALRTDDDDEASLDEEQMSALRRCLERADLDDDERREIESALDEVED